MTRTTTIVTDIVNKVSADNDCPCSASSKTDYFQATCGSDFYISNHIIERCYLCLASFKRVKHRLYVAINQSYQTAAKIQTWLRWSVLNLSLRLKNPYCYEHGQITNVNLTDRIIKWYNRGSLNPCYHWILKKINFYDVAEYVV